MNAQNDELIDFFKALYSNEQEADDIKAGIKDDLKSFASKIEASPKAVNAAYALFKKYASGKQTQQEGDEYYTLAEAVKDHFDI